MEWKPKTRHIPHFDERTSVELQVAQICDPEGAILRGMNRYPDGNSIRTGLIGQRTDFSGWQSNSSNSPLVSFIHVGHPQVEFLQATQYAQVGRYQSSGRIATETLQLGQETELNVDVFYQQIPDGDSADWAIVTKSTRKGRESFPALSDTSFIRFVAMAYSDGTAQVIMKINVMDKNTGIVSQLTAGPQAINNITMVQLTSDLDGDFHLLDCLIAVQTEESTGGVRLLNWALDWDIPGAAISSSDDQGFYRSNSCQNYETMISMSDKVRCIASSALVTDANSELNKAGFIALGQNYDGIGEIITGFTDISSRLDGRTFSAENGCYSALFKVDSSSPGFYNMVLTESDFISLLNGPITLCSYAPPNDSLAQNVRGRFCSIYEVKGTKSQLLDVASMHSSPRVMECLTAAFFSEPFLTENKLHLKQVGRFLKKAGEVAKQVIHIGPQLIEHVKPFLTDPRLLEVANNVQTGMKKADKLVSKKK